MIYVAPVSSILRLFKTYSKFLCITYLTIRDKSLSANGSWLDTKKIQLYI